MQPIRFRIKRGLDIPLAGTPRQQISPAPEVQRVAVRGNDYPGLLADVRVSEGERVSAGEVLVQDRRRPEVLVTAPVSGIVEMIHRGAGRSLQSIVIRCDGDTSVDDPSAPVDLAEADGDAIRRMLLDAGLWTSFRTRPFSRIPAIDTTPAAIFVTAMDTTPLGPDPDVVIGSRQVDYFDGLRVLNRLSDNPVYVCQARPITGMPSEDGICEVSIEGPHPAGLVGTHIHLLHPVTETDVVWHLHYQDVIAIGHYFNSGRLDFSRVISLAGPMIEDPRLVRVPAGASTEDLVGAELAGLPCRVISGSVLSGHWATGPDAFLGRYHLQVNVIGESEQREFLGWLRPGLDKFSESGLFLSKLLPRRRFPLTTSKQGSPRAMVPIGSYERVMPLELLITPLLKALLVGDIETAIGLGCLELDEEDLALCSFVCCSKYDFGSALREVLTTIEGRQ